MVHSLWHTSNRPLVIPFMAAVLGPLEQTVQDPVEPLLFLSPFYFRSPGVEEPSYSLGPRTFLLLLLPPWPSRQRGSRLRVQWDGGVGPGRPASTMTVVVSETSGTAARLITGLPK